MPALTSSARPPGAEANEHFSSRDLNSLSAWLRWSLALGLVSAVTLAFRLLPFAVHTATLLAAYLLAVLALATTLRLPETVAAILAATLELNYFFLPPVGTLTIADPQNWVALSAFLLTAAIGSRLALHARKQTTAAERRFRDAARLNEFGRALLLAAPEELPAEIERWLVSVFAYGEARLLAPANPALAAEPSPEPGLRRLELALGGRAVACLHVEGRPLAAELEAAVGGIAAIALERARVERVIARVRLLEQSEQVKTALLDSVTHELRTPLTSIRAAATALLSSDTLPPDARRELLQVIDADCGRLDELLESLVQMASLEAGAHPLRCSAVSAEAIIEAAVASARFDLSRLQCRLSPVLPPLSVDPALAGRALVQLLKNAAAYSLPGSPIELAVEPEDGVLRWRLSNQCEPLPPELESQLFKKFSRGPRASRRNPGGLGMGLAIARAIISAHGGQIGIERRTLPASSIGHADTVSFVFTLPAAARRPAPPAAAAAAKP